MKHHFTSLSIWVLLLVLPAQISAQVLTAEHQMPCHRDSFEVYKMTYVTMGDSGRNCIWDFSELPVDSAEIISLDYFASSSIYHAYRSSSRTCKLLLSLYDGHPMADWFRDIPYTCTLHQACTLALLSIRLWRFGMRNILRQRTILPYHAHVR